MLHTKAKMDGSNELGAKSTLGLSGSSFSAGSVANGLSVLQNQILAIVRTFVGERGIPVSQLCEKLRGIPERQIRLVARYNVN